MKLGEFYDYYSAAHRAAQYFGDPPVFFKGLKKQKTALICLELFIDYETVCFHLNSIETNPDSGHLVETTDPTSR